jgi:hypothetical protein
MRSPSATGRNHPSLQTKVSVNSGPSHSHNDSGTQPCPTTETIAPPTFSGQQAPVDTQDLARVDTCTGHKAIIARPLRAHMHSPSMQAYQAQADVAVPATHKQHSPACCMCKHCNPLGTPPDHAVARRKRQTVKRRHRGMAQLHAG